MAQGKMNSQKKNWYDDLLKINIWIIILIAGFLWNTFIEPALSKDFVTQDQMQQYKQSQQEIIKQLEAKINSLKSFKRR